MNENSSAKDANKPKKPRVKIVASRYAQTLQKSNLEIKYSDRSESSDRKLKRSFSARDTPSKPIVASKGIARSSSGNLNRPTSLILQRQHSVQQQEETRSVQERLKEYRAKKELEKQQSIRKKPLFRPTDSVSTSRPSNVPISRPRPPISGGVVAIPQTPAPAIKLNTRTPISAASLATPIHSSVDRRRVDMEPPSIHRSPPYRSEQEEMELLQCMYYQLCLCEAKADDAFTRQQKSAECRLLAAWEIAKSRMQLLHDTAIRLDREKHIHQLDSHLQDQSGSFANVLIKLETFMSFGTEICEALQAALYRLPTPGLYCTSSTLKNRLDELSASLETMLELLESNEFGKMVKDMVSFEDSMRSNMEELSKNLISLSSLTEDLQTQLDAETSMKILQIQEKRLQQTTSATAVTGNRWFELFD